MEKQQFLIEKIPCVLWGEGTGKLFLAVHGSGSHKEDTVIRLFGEQAAQNGCQTLSLDLPRHGARRNEARVCSAQNAVEDLYKVLAFAQAQAAHIGLFGCSMGAYFGLLAFQNRPVRQALLLSPVVDMARLIGDSMHHFHISEVQLQKEGRVETPGQTLDWQDYQYVCAHPVHWHMPASLLYGEHDHVVPYDSIRRFVRESNADLTVMQAGEHYFHTAKQLAFFSRWLGAQPYL